LITFNSLLATGPIFVPDGNNPSDTDSEPQASDVRVIPGTAWKASTGTYSNGFRFCQIYRDIEDGVRVGLTAGSSGTLALIVEDKYMEGQVSEALGWVKEGESYRAVLRFDNDKRVFTVQATRMQEHALLIPLKAINRDMLFRTKQLGVGVGAIAFRGYDLTGLHIAGPELLECFRQSRRAGR
jgi:hypothetical protein